ncbi:MAG: TolC family protein [Tannerellaceae bacterium]|jgi:outer membrane protein|nr:TolC family protein [Tannerellaceae bacterium]
MKKIVTHIILLSSSVIPAISLQSQEATMSMDDCIRYAVENSPGVRRAAYTYDTYKSEYTNAVGAFFPSLTVGASAQYNFGRAVDPETNTYINTTTFNNNYESSASLPIFRGGQLVNQWRLAKNNRQMGLNDIQKIMDDLSLNTMEAYANAVYYQGTIRYAAEKLEESRRNLHKTRRQEELGLKGRADLAQIEATVAADDYLLAHQQNLCNAAMLKLKEYMNYPYDRELLIDTATPAPDYAPHTESVIEIFNYAQAHNPTARQAAYQTKAAHIRHLMAKGKMFPTISLSAGIYTSYYENLMAAADPLSFNAQFKNNRGEYISLNIRIPILDGMNTITDVRRARNNMRIAVEQQSEVLRQLETAIEQSILDRNSYAKESIQMEKKLAADEIAYQLTLRKYEEGLTGNLELQSASNALLESKASLLQCRLMYILKARQVEYYKGKKITEN